jgi:porin
LGIFARYGYAPEEVNRIEHFWSVGAVYEGLFEHRDQDRLGFGVAQSILSDAYEREVDPLADRETVYELYYSIMVTPWLTITPDVQVITNPGGRNDARDALVGGLRIKLVF